jgi:spore coat protein SA
VIGERNSRLTYELGEPKAKSQKEPPRAAMIFHLLPENEPFSAFSGVAISRNVSNMMRLDASRVVVCPRSDDSWGFSADRIMVLPGLRLLARAKGRRFIPRLLTNVFFSWVFRPLLSRLRPGDIVWCHNQPFYCAALEATIREKGAKLVYHAHNSICDRPTRAAFGAFTADATIFVSQAIRNEASRSLPWLKNTYVVYNGADEQRFYPKRSRQESSDRVPVVLFVGRLVPRKGVHILIEAMAILKERGVNAACRIVGSSFAGGSKQTSYVRSLIKSCPSNVHFAAFRSGTEIAEEYRAADILCCPSNWEEPFGNVNIEAMACGVPVVASRVGGIPEIASDGGIILVEPGRADQLADALQMLLEDESLRTQVGRKGMESFRRKFTWTAACREYQSVVDCVRENEVSRVAINEMSESR